MKRIYLPVLLTSLLLSFESRAALADDEPSPTEAWGPELQVLLDGVVLLPCGAPGAGALVVSSAGGKALTDELGRFELELRLDSIGPPLRVSAIRSQAGVTQVATRIVSMGAVGTRVSVGELRLGVGGTCEPGWLPTFGGGAFDAPVRALAVFDDGSGPALFVGGHFTRIGGFVARSIAKWDGRSWSRLASGTDGWVLALAVHDDGGGGGPALYAAGTFTQAGGVSANYVARWNGAAWSALGTGLDQWALALASHDDGGGPALFVAGQFGSAGGSTANRIARWDGSTWAPLGTGANASIHSLLVHDDGSGGGAALHAGGAFTDVGGVVAKGIARWDGAAWSALGDGVDGTVLAMASEPAGPGGTGLLYAGGQFTTTSGLVANGIASWDGLTWSTLAGGVGGGGSPDVHALLVHDDGSGNGPALIVAGSFLTAGGTSAPRIAKWQGSSWHTLGGGVDGLVHALALYDDGRGSGPCVQAGGWFDHAGDATASRVASWDGSTWSSIGDYLTGDVRALAVHDDRSGSGPALYVGGSFSSAGGAQANRVAKWDGSSWSALGSGMNNTVLALAVHDDGSGPALYAGGSFTTAGGVNAQRIARWNGSTWSSVGGNMYPEGSAVYALVVHDDGLGGGPALYAGGSFTYTGTSGAQYIAKWNGQTWVNLANGTGGWVLALAVHEGSGGAPALFAGGSFAYAGGTLVNRIAQWDGWSWSALGSGLGPNGSEVNALAVHDDGSGAGPALYAAGSFKTAGGAAANRIARWDGASWSPLGMGTDGVIHALAVYDDGTAGGRALYAGGDFGQAGGTSTGRIAKWRGGAWSAVGEGINDSVRALLVHATAGDGPALYVGGKFTSTVPCDAYLSRWGGCARIGFAYCFGDGSGTLCPCGNQAGAGGGCANSTGMGGALGAHGTNGLGADDLLLRATYLRPNQPALLFAGTNAVNGGNGVGLGDGLRCAGGSIRRLGIRVPDVHGTTSWGPGLSAFGNWVAGDTRRFQVWYRDPGLSPCGSGFNLTNAYEVTFAQ